VYLPSVYSSRSAVGVWNWGIFPGRPSRTIGLRRSYSPPPTLIFRKSGPKFLIYQPLY